MMVMRVCGALALLMVLQGCEEPFSFDLGAGSEPPVAAAEPVTEPAPEQARRSYANDRSGGGEGGGGGAGGGESSGSSW